MNTAIQTLHDWTILEVFEVEATVNRVSKVTADRLGLDPDDVLQEARIITADMTCNVYAAAVGFEYGLLYHRLSQDLRNHYERELNHRNKQESFEARYDASEDDSAGRAAYAVTPRASGSGYDRPLVELLIPAVWDEAYCYGIQQENAPDEDMPRASSNKATGNTLAAHLADIRSAWKQAPLTDAERRALVLIFGMDWSYDEAGYNQGCTKQAIDRRVYRGVGKIVAFLNGDEALMENVTEGDES